MLRFVVSIDSSHNKHLLNCGCGSTGIAWMRDWKRGRWIDKEREGKEDAKRSCDGVMRITRTLECCVGVQ